MEIIKKIRAPVDKAIDGVIKWIIDKARKLGKWVAQAGVPHDPNERLKLAARAALPAAKALKGKGKISAGMLEKVLGFLKTRYALTVIQPFESKGQWMIRLKINPETVLPSGLILVEGTGSGAREQEGPDMAPIVEKLRQVREMFKLWARLGTAPVAQPMLRMVGTSMELAESLKQDQKKGVVGLAPRFAQLSTSLRAIQVLDPGYQLMSIGQMEITLNQAKRRMPEVVLSYHMPSTVPLSHPMYATWLDNARVQLREQEAGVNAMVVSEWLARRPAMGTKFVRPAGEKAMRDRYGERSQMAGTGMAAPHNPDQVLAGYIDPTGSPAISYVNSFIGGQNKTNAQTLQTAVTTGGLVDPIAYPVTQMKVRLVI